DRDRRRVLRQRTGRRARWRRGTARLAGGNMTALSSAALRARLQTREHARRLVISPILDPEAQLKPNPARIHLRLGPAFTLVRPWTQGVADRFEGAGSDDEVVTPAEPPLERVSLEHGEPLIIHPHQFVLARTLEFVRLPTDLMAYVIGRSSWGRRGLI